MPSCLLLIGLIVISQAISAGEVIQSSVDNDAGIYRISFVVEIDKDIDTVRKVVTDYANLARLSDMLIESRVYSVPDDKLKQRLLVARVCLLFICRQVRMVERIEPIGPDVIVTTVIPELSDFKSGQIRWRLTKLTDQRTRLEFFGEEQPDFWIPPVIGPLLIKHILHREAFIITTNIENLSADG